MATPGTHRVVQREGAREARGNRRRVSPQRQPCLSGGCKRTESRGDKKTGGKNYRDLVYVDRIEFLNSRSNGNGTYRPDESNEGSTVPDEEIPF